MIHICFAYIRNYKALRNISLKIDSRNDYSYNAENNSLSISPNPRYPVAFWGMGVYSLAAIVGNNGAGKSTSMEFILNTLVDGANTKEVEGVLVYEQDGKLLVWGKDVKVNTHLPFSIVRNIPKITCFYYCGHFMPEVSYNDLRSTELTGCYNASDGWLLVKDLQSYSNIDSLFLTQPLFRHLNYFIAQNNHRICTMLADEKVRNTVKEFCLPKYVQIGINDSGEYALDEKNRRAEEAARQKKYPVATKIVSIPQKTIVHSDSRNRYLEQLVYYNFLNLMNEGLREDSDGTRNMLIAWQEYKNPRDPMLEQFESFIKQCGCSQGLLSDLSAVLYVLKKVDRLCSFFDNGATQCYYLNTDADGKQLKELAEDVLGKRFYTTAKFFNMYFSQGLGTNTILSSGEQNLLDIFSRLYDALITSPMHFANIDSKRLILLDEAEIGFHPDWQRRYISLLLDFLQTMVVVKPGEDFQVLISTHSPVLLSDIPNCCVNYLEVDDTGFTRNVEDMKDRESFATNVFEQYKNSFFMGDGLVGEYARKKLQEIQKSIDDGEITPEIRQLVSIVGDSRVREYLEQQMTQKNIDLEISYYEEKLKKLREERERRHE